MKIEIMSFRYSKIDLRFSIYTKDNKCFRYCYLNYKVKRNFAWLWSKLFGSDGMLLDRLIVDCVRDIFERHIEQAYMYEGKDINRLIREDRLRFVNSLINDEWKLNYSKALNFHVKDIEITHLIR